MSCTLLLDKLDTYQDCHEEAAQTIRLLLAEIEKLLSNRML